MKILLNITHPAHVHFFKNFIRVMRENGHEIFVFARNKDITFRLLDAFDIHYTVLGRHHKYLVGKLLGSIIHIVKLINYTKKYKIDILLDSGPIYLAPVSFVTSKPYIIANNTDANFVLNISKYFKTYYIHNASFRRNLGKRQIRIESINELAFLHPKYFKYDQSIVERLGLNKGEKLILLRFVLWKSVDDIGLKGFSIQEIRTIVERFLKHGRVIISSEYDLPEDLDQYRIETNLKIPYGKLQDIEANCTLFFGESGAMASECAMLGVPSFYVSTKSLGFTEELDNKYGLVFDYRDKDKALEKALSLLKNQNMEKQFQDRRKKLLYDKINYTDFLVWYVSNFPQSFHIMKRNPNYQFRFK